ncbi:UNVERIFIED_CONTAM: hypothetical protein K2H54_025542 [Gekko kuhli]
MLLWLVGQQSSLQKQALIFECFCRYLSLSERRGQVWHQLGILRQLLKAPLSPEDPLMGPQWSSSKEKPPWMDQSHPFASHGLFRLPPSPPPTASGVRGQEGPSILSFLPATDYSVSLTCHGQEREELLAAAASHLAASQESRWAHGKEQKLTSQLAQFCSCSLSPLNLLSAGSRKMPQ